MPPPSNDSPLKLLPRNVAALRRGRAAPDAAQGPAGNPVSTQLEAGVGNCFPGLECDLRNLERRFFPYLEVNIDDRRLAIVGLDMAAARADRLLTGAQLTVYEDIEQTLDVDAGGASNWSVTSIGGDFGPLGAIADLQIAGLRPPSSGAGRRPPDAWTAIRLLKEGSEVTLSLAGPNGAARLTGRRARYLGDDGALAAMFLPGELTQSLCSPWTHDFRDCACYYWASNHPDIVQPTRPPGATDPHWNDFVDWERSDRNQAVPPPSATVNGPVARQMAHYDINSRWQQLHMVLRGREQVEPLVAQPAAGVPFATDAELIANLRLAAGVELAVMQEYLCAAFSLVADTGAATPLARAVRAARAEIMRVAIGEMRHLRVVNEVLALMPGAPLPFRPALQVSLKIPTTDPATFRAREFRPLTAETMDLFIEVESAAHAVDQLYSNVMATFRQRGNDHLVQVVASIIADGQDHLETFGFIEQWLAPFGASVLRPNLRPATPADPSHVALQAGYVDVLEGLFSGYSAGLPQGAPVINTARQGMVQVGGLVDLATAAANAGLLVSFDDLADPRFKPLV